VKLLHPCDVHNEKKDDLVIGLLGITSSFVVGMGVGRGGRGALDPWIVKLLANKGCFSNFEGQKPNFTIFGSSWKKFLGKSSTGPPPG